MPSRFFPIGYGLLLAVLATAPAAQEFGETVVKRGTYQRDLYVAGGDVSVLATVGGDVIAAGGQVTVDDEVSGDVMAAGGRVTLRVRVHDDVRAAGGAITFSGTAGDEAVFAGGRVHLDPDSIVTGRALLAGGRIDVGGRVGKNLHAAGGEIRITGELLGDARLIGENIEIGPGAIIRGNLVYRSPNEARIDSDARIMGQVLREALDLPDTRGPVTGARVFVALSMFATALVYFLLFPRFSMHAARQIRAAPLASLGLGLAMLAATPFVVVLLMVTAVGVWLGLVLLAAYLTLAMLGYITGALFIADFGVRELHGEKETRRIWIVVTLAVTLVLLALLSWMPIVNGIVTFALMLLGLGALARALVQRYSTRV
jgi:hypothetical protein